MTTIFSTFRALILGTLLFAGISALGQDGPRIDFLSLYGGSGTDDCDAVSVDSEGNTYLGCHVTSSDLPGSDKYSYSLKGNMDAFLVKLDGGDNSVGYITHWGGENWDGVQGVVVGTDGSVFVVGATYSGDLQASSFTAQPTFGGSSDVFISKVDPAGRIAWTTYFGGSGDEDSNDIVLDEQGNIHIAGRTSSPNLATNANSYQRELAGSSDAFIATFDSNGQLLYASYLGGSGEDVGAGLAVDRVGRRFVSGFTDSSDFPEKNSLGAKSFGDQDIFVAVLNPQGNMIDFSTYLGGSGADRAVSLRISDSGTIIVTGDTTSPDLPVTIEGSSFSGGRSDVFLAHVDFVRPGLHHLSYLGGSGADRVLNMELSEAGKVVIVGDTTSPNFPISYDFRSTVNGDVDDAYIAVFDIQNTSTPTTILTGGTGIDFFEGVAIGSDGLITVSGGSNSTDLPAVRPLHTEFMGGRFDILVAKFYLGAPP